MGGVPEVAVAQGHQDEVADGVDTVSCGQGVSEQGVSYEVLEGTRVVAVTTATTVSLPLPGAARRYAVRAVDAAGNRSASTPAVAFDPASVPVEVTLLASTATWRWRWWRTIWAATWPGVLRASW